MYEQPHPLKTTERSSLSSLLIIIGLFMVFMLVGSLLGLTLGSLAIGISPEKGFDLMKDIQDSPGNRTFLLINQAVAAFFAMVLMPLVYWKVFEKKPIAWFNYSTIKDTTLFPKIFFLIATLIPFIGMAGKWNQGLKLPSFLSDLEKSIKNSEEKATALTEIIGKADSIPQLLISLFVIAFLAALGEELIFRGLIQRKIWRGIKNPHVAIWLTAIIFSAIHMQFYGFVPRLILGAMLGYLYYWTGNLWAPVFAHFVNNALAVIAFYMVNKKVEGLELDKPEDITPVGFIAVSWCLSVAIFYFIYQKNYGEKLEIDA